MVKWLTIILVVMVIMVLTTAVVDGGKGKGKAKGKAKGKDKSGGKSKSSPESSGPKSLKSSKSPRCDSDKPAGSYRPFIGNPAVQLRTIEGCDIEVNVGVCPLERCRFDTCLDPRCDFDGVTCAVTTETEITCEPVEGIQADVTFDKVTACVCCKDEGITITILVVDATDTSMGLENITVIINNNEETLTTDSDGNIVVTLPPSDPKTYVFQAVDPNGIYTPFIKVEEDVLDGQSVTIHLSQPNFGPIIIDESVIQILPNVEISFEPGSLPDGATFEATVYNPLEPIDTLPLQFITDDGELLITAGILIPCVKDAQGNLLFPVNVTISVLPPNQLWLPEVDPVTGMWTLMDQMLVTDTRRKRQDSLSDIITTLTGVTPINIDQLLSNSLFTDCFFKTRAFEQNGVPITAMDGVSYRPTYQGITSANGTFNLYLPAINDPSLTCIKSRCPADPNDLRGFIQMRIKQSVTLTGGLTIELNNLMFPRLLIDYTNSDAVTALTNVDYAVLTGDNRISTIANSSSEGPYYTNEELCNDGNVFFEFIQPSLPSYVQSTDDINDTCTAQIVLVDFLDEDLFSNFSLPTIIATSIWIENGDTLFDSSSFDNGTVNVKALSYCVSYRCSEPGNLTSVNIVVDDIPTDPDNNDEQLYGCGVLIGGYIPVVVPGPGIYTAPENNEPSCTAGVALTLKCRIGGFEQIKPPTRP